MKLKLFDYHLPVELIAQFPHRQRNLSRLMVVDRKSGQISHTSFRRITDYLNSEDALVINNTRVFKARLVGRRASGARVEILLVRKVGESGLSWRSMVRPSRRVKPGELIEFSDVGTAQLESDLGGGYWQVGFLSKSSQSRIMSSCGHVPLPPYISREDQPSDIRRYQTVYADKDRIGAVAAPTAGFHFTKSLLNKIKNQGADIVELTLHVGPGTFKPISSDDIGSHVVDPEYAEISEAAAKQLNQIRQTGGSLVAVGTTSVRTLESAVIGDGRIKPLDRMVDLYIKPGHNFQAVDRLITNFHLPKSSLLVLVSAFAGTVLIMEAYQEAIRERYQFYSYGDAMLIL